MRRHKFSSPLSLPSFAARLLLSAGLILTGMTGAFTWLGCEKIEDTSLEIQLGLPEEVVWLEGQTWSEITTLASGKGQHILIDFYATWCGPCKMLDKEVYVVPEVIRELGRLVTFKVDVDKPEYEELTDNFHIFNYPTLVLCEPDGTEVDRFLGFRPPDEFLEVVHDYLAGRNTLADVEARLAQTPHDPQLLLQAGTKRAHLLDQELARDRLARAIIGDAGNSAGVASAAITELADLDWKLGNYDQAIATYRRVLDSYPDSGEAEEALHMIAYCQRKQGDLEGMVDTYREMVRRNPEDIGALNGFAWNAAKAGIALEEATDIALKAAALSDEDPQVLDTLAEVYHMRGMHQEAIDWVRKAIAREPDDEYLQGQLAKYQEAAEGGQP